MDELRPWRCKNGHVMGMSGRSAAGIRQLMVFRHAIDTADLGDAPDVIAVAEGMVMDVRCDICGEMRTWVPGQEAIERLVARYREEVGVEQNRC
jgi:hypothetical protein